MDNPRLQFLIALVLLLVAVGGVTDVYLDTVNTVLGAHILFEIILIVITLGLGLYLMRGWIVTARSLGETRRELATRREERDRWRSRAERALAGFGQEVNRQFDEWGLTPAEKEVALFVIKGHSHKRIAYMTGRSERTVRQHATSVYTKARLAGRNELAAFFLEGLMIPRAPELTRANPSLQPPDP